MYIINTAYQIIWFNKTKRTSISAYGCNMLIPLIQVRHFYNYYFHHWYNTVFIAHTPNSYLRQNKVKIKKIKNKKKVWTISGKRRNLYQIKGKMRGKNREERKKK